MKALDLDINELLHRLPDSGILQFMGQRVLLFDALALGLLREELIATLGINAARGILTRFGYAHGWRTAEVLRRDHPELFKDSWAGPHLHTLFGLLTADSNIRSRGEENEPLTVATWHDSYEVEQYHLHYGESNEPVCWTLTGFASGYVSNRTEREVYFLETSCCGMGDSVCRIEARFKEEWGKEVESQLSYFHMESVDATLAELTTKIKDIEKQLQQKQRQLKSLDSNDETPCISCRSQAILKTVDMAKRIAKVDSSVVISGDTGVGK